MLQITRFESYFILCYITRRVGVFVLTRVSKNIRHWIYSEKCITVVRKYSSIDFVRFDFFLLKSHCDDDIMYFHFFFLCTLISSTTVYVEEISYIPCLNSTGNSKYKRMMYMFHLGNI